jgi:hypothetical protein
VNRIILSAIGIALGLGALYAISNFITPNDTQEAGAESEATNKPNSEPMSLYEICEKLHLATNGDIIYMTNPLDPSAKIKIYINAEDNVFEVVED